MGAELLLKESVRLWCASLLEMVPAAAVQHLAAATISNVWQALCCILLKVPRNFLLWA